MRVLQVLQEAFPVNTQIYIIKKLPTPQQSKSRSILHYCEAIV